MREIKFRGKKISNGKWVHGYLTRVENDYAVIEYDNEDGRYNHLVYEKLAAHTFPARDGKQYAYYCAMVERYRKRAAWYVNKNRNEK